MKMAYKCNKTTIKKNFWIILIVKTMYSCSKNKIKLLIILNILMIKTPQILLMPLIINYNNNNNNKK